MLKFMYPELGVPLPDRSYAEDCDLSVDNLKVQRRNSNVFMIGHEITKAKSCLEPN